ncbi:MAG TPA: hypothetical protein DDZ51_19480 [Planctomycetaceae bacterium]|nr:hypothetical protein [Planctomycetaceae bacterium]
MSSRKLHNVASLLLDVFLHAVVLQHVELWIKCRSMQKTKTISYAHSSSLKVISESAGRRAVGGASVTTNGSYTRV